MDTAKFSMGSNSEKSGFIFWPHKLLHTKIPFLYQLWLYAPPWACSHSCSPQWRTLVYGSLPVVKWKLSEWMIEWLGRRQTWQTRYIRSETWAASRRVSCTLSLKLSSQRVVVFVISGRRSDQPTLHPANVSLWKCCIFITTHEVAS